MSQQANPRGPGRPRADTQPNTRQSLIDAARELFSARDFEAVSTKRIADAAGVNPAMIHYHFKDKSGLLEAAFREAIEPIVERLAALSSSADDDETAIAQLFEIYMTTLAANPWLPKMILRHVFPEGARLQSFAARKIGARVAPAIAQLIANGQRQGHLRADLDPRLTTISIVSLALFPFLALPLVQRIFGLAPDAELITGLVEHTTTLFHCGAAT